MASPYISRHGKKWGRVCGAFLQLQLQRLKSVRPFLMDSLRLIDELDPWEAKQVCKCPLTWPHLVALLTHVAIAPKSLVPPT